MTPNRVLVIGLDGATFDLIRTWAEEEKLPTLKRLMGGGSWGVLESTPFPNSAPAWVSCLAGVNPGKHGIFGFGVRTNNKYQYQLANSTLIAVKTIPEILTEYGMRSIVINVPVTYPPFEIDGVVVSGMGTPGKESDFTFPVGFKNTLFEEFPDYVIEVPFYNYDQRKMGQKRGLFDAYLKSIAQRKRLVLSLINQQDWNFFMVVFSELDRIQHYFWGYMDERHPLYYSVEAKTFRSAVYEAYRTLDKALAEILDSVNLDNCQIFIVSDHGFGVYSELFYLNLWLSQERYLYLNIAKGQRLKELIKKGRVFGPIARTLVEKVQESRKVRLDPGNWRKEKVERQVPIGRIDWSKTKAFGDEYGIRINLKGREEHGVVSPGTECEKLKSALRQQLMRLRFKKSGKPVFLRILPKEEVYWGPMLDRAPDLVTFTEVGGIQLSIQANEIFGSSITSGQHRREGVLIVCGQGVLSTELGNNSIYDLAPTILAFLGLPRTPEMDGNVLPLCNDHSYVKMIKQVDGTSFRSAQDEKIYSAEESRILEERLEGLGYL